MSWEVLSEAPSELLMFGSGPEPESGDVRLIQSKLEAANAVRSLQQRPQLVVLGHLNFLKLLPFIPRADEAKVVLFLYGVESWKRASLLNRSLLGRVDQFLAISQYTWNAFIGRNPRLRQASHAIVPLGVDSPAARRDEPDGVPTAIMVSRMARGEDYKGHREVLSVWERVRQQIPDARLWLVGDGDLRPDLEALVTQLRIHNCVSFFGRVSDDRRNDLISRAHCLLMPSTGEGFGLAYLEAMRLGRPCLSGLDGGREVVAAPECGFSVHPSDHEQLVSAIVRLLTPDQFWRRLSLASRQRYQSRFTAHHFRDRLKEVLRSLAP